MVNIIRIEKKRKNHLIEETPGFLHQQQHVHFQGEPQEYLLVPR